MNNNSTPACNQAEDTSRLDAQEASNRRRTLVVVILTGTAMVMEIVFGLLTQSMSLLADGVHMGTHTLALLIALVAYLIIARNRSNPDFPFGPGKVGVLGGYTNAILLGLTALFMIKESVERLLHPVQIQYGEAIIVAVIGLAVNLVSALVLGGGHSHDHGHGHEHHDDHSHAQEQHHHEDPDHHHEHSEAEHGHHHDDHEDEHEDHNLKAAYMHVITDAFTSILAIGALTAGAIWNLTWPDAVVGIVGALVILKWAWGLLSSTSAILVDHVPSSREREGILTVLESRGLGLADLHVLESQGRGRILILALEGVKPGTDLEALKGELRRSSGAAHITLDCCS